VSAILPDQTTQSRVALKRYRLALILMGLPLLGVGVILLCVRFGEGF
jgi:hypothetical protein